MGDRPGPAARGQHVAGPQPGPALFSTAVAPSQQQLVLQEHRHGQMAGPPPPVHHHGDPYAAYYQSHMAAYPPGAAGGGGPPPPPHPGGGGGGGAGDQHLHGHHAAAGPGGLHAIAAQLASRPDAGGAGGAPALPSLSSRVATPLLHGPGAYSAAGVPPPPPSHALSSALVGQQQQQQHHTPAMSNAPLPPAPPSAGSGTQASPHMPKARSAMACQLCRRQKMKCEGPEKAPCRRCRAAQVDCVFEAPPAAPPRPRGGGVTEAWVEGRLGQVEHRLDMLEDTAANSQALVAGNGSAASVAPQTITDHERRIAALEAQLYNLQITMARQVQIPPQQQQPQPHPSAYGPGPSNPAGIEYHAQHQQQQSHNPYGGPSNPYASSYSHPSLASPAPASHARYDSPSGAGSGTLKHESDRSNSAASMQTGAAASSGDSHREKRWKGEGEGDFIARGLVSEEEAALCFDSYHLTFSNNGLEQASDQHHLSFEETRRRSPLFLATIISIGARSLSRFDTFHTTYREAVRLAHDSFIPSATAEGQADPSAPPAGDSVLPSFARSGAHSVDDANTNSILEFRLPTLTLKALILLGLYHSMPELLVHAWMAGYRFIQPQASQAFYEMTPEERSSPKARGIVNHTRVGLVAWLWLSFYTYCRGHHGAIWLGSTVLRRRLETLQQSAYGEQPTDGVIRTNFEGVTIMHSLYQKIGAGVKGVRATPDEVFEAVKEALADLDEWNARNFQMMETISQWGDSADLKSIVPLHYFRLFVLMYVFRDVPMDRIDTADPQTETWARMAAESAIVLLRWGVESRIWMPFSVVGNYVHNVNVPAALWLLGTLARLYPSLIDFHSVRPLLHRLAKQCTATVSSPGATYREIVRARKTKHEVEELDRIAFELCEADAVGPGAVAVDGRTSRASAREYGVGAGAGAGAGAQGQSSSASSSAAGDAGDAGDAPGLFGHEVTASLNSLRLELNLWAKPLRGFEDDD